jgi:hypothetical protein
MSDFENKLLSIIQERETVLFEIERVLFTKRYKLSSKHFEIFAIQSITMIYSIWEGFIQKAFQLYVSELNTMGIDFLNFSDEITIFHMDNTFKQLKDYPKDEKKKNKFYSQLDCFSSNKYHPLHSIINTESNVSFKTLNELLKTFCLNTFEEHWGKYKHPNPNLKECLNSFLRYRNGIAHGGDISSEEKVTQQVYEKYRTLILDLMYEILTKMTTGLNNKTYLKINK